MNFSSRIKIDLSLFVALTKYDTFSIFKVHIASVELDKLSDTNPCRCKKVNKRKMYNYDYIGQLTMMYSAKEFGLIQIKDIKKNNDYAIRLQLYKKPGTCAYLLKENLAKYRVRKVSISHDKFRRKFKSHYDLFHMCDEKPAVVAAWYTCWNMFYGVLKKRNYEKSI